MEKNLKITLSIIFISTIAVLWMLFFRFNQIEVRSDEKAFFTVMPSPPTYKELSMEEITEVIEIINSADKSFRGPYILSGWQQELTLNIKEM